MRLKLPATKSNLLSVRENLHLAREGHDLLSQKKEVLYAELLHLVADVNRVREEAQAALAQAYMALRSVTAEIGPDGAKRLSEGCSELADVVMRERSVMGVIVPLLELRLPAKQPVWSLGESPLMIDEVVERCRRSLVLLCEQAEIETAARRLADEMAKTQLRINALEYFVIPQYEETEKFFQETLEEREREEHFQIKRARSRLRK